MYNLSLRGYLGVMEVDHENGTIGLRVCLSFFQIIVIIPSKAYLLLDRSKQTIKHTINCKVRNGGTLPC
jgi:hypothetical protein